MIAIGDHEIGLFVPRVEQLQRSVIGLSFDVSKSNLDYLPFPNWTLIASIRTNL